MRSHKAPNITLPYAPPPPRPPVDPTKWRRIGKNVYALGNRAGVGETTGSKDPAKQRWDWRICAFDGDLGTHSTREEAMRAAEFSLGLGEMEVVE